MTIILSPDLQKLIDERIKSGKYVSPEAVMLAALHSLEREEKSGDFAPSEMDGLLAAGESSGESLDGEQVLAELRARRDPPRTKAG